MVTLKLCEGPDLRIIEYQRPNAHLIPIGTAIKTNLLLTENTSYFSPLFQCSCNSCISLSTQSVQTLQNYLHTLKAPPLQYCHETPSSQHIASPSGEGTAWLLHPLPLLLLLSPRLHYIWYFSCFFLQVFQENFLSLGCKLCLGCVCRLHVEHTIVQ